MRANEEESPTDNASSFNKELMETEHAFALMSIKNDTLDSHLARLKRKLAEREEESLNAYKNLLAVEEEAETKKNVLLSLRQSLRVEVNRGEDLKRQIEEGNTLLEKLQARERKVVDKYEEDSMKLIEKTREIHYETHEMTTKVNAMREKIRERQSEGRQLEDRVEKLKREVEEARENGEYEGLKQVATELTPISKRDLDTERKYISDLGTLMTLNTSNLNAFK